MRCEPPRDSWRPVGLSHVRHGCLGESTFVVGFELRWRDRPVGWSRRVWLNQAPSQNSTERVVLSRPCKTHFSANRLTRGRAEPAATGQGWRDLQS